MEQFNQQCNLKNSILLFLLLFVQILPIRAQTNVRAWYAEGQVWIIWEVETPLPETYGIYTSNEAFSNVEQATLIGRPFYLEYMPAVLREQVDDTQNYIIPDGEGGLYELAANEGLFVATPHQSGNQYFAVVQWGETTVTTGENITDDAVEIAYDPVNDPVQCHLQKTFPSPYTNGYTCRAYMMWADGRQAHWEGRPDFPIMANAAKNGMPSLFMISAPNGLDISGEAVPLTVWLHGGTGSATQSLAGRREIVNIDPQEGILLAHNDDLIGWRNGVPGLGAPSWHFGWRKNWSPFVQGDYPTGQDTVINYTQRRYIWIDDWLVQHYNVDPHRISINGHSMGSAGTTALAKCYPSHYASASIHSNGFHGPTTNQAAIIYGYPTDNFPTNLVNSAGEHVRFNEVWNIIDNCSPERDWPLLRTWHGKRDINTAMAWDEEVVNNYRIADSLGMGVQIFWSERAHGMNNNFNDHWYYGYAPDKQTVYDNTDYEEAHFRSDTWLPAFFNHRQMQGIPDPGNGTFDSGSEWGTWGGYHRWEDLSVTDEAGTASIQGVFWLEEGAVFDNDNCPVTFLDADLYIRRLPDDLGDLCGASLSYSLSSLDDDYTQSGTVHCEGDNLLRLDNVRIFRKDIRKLRLEINLSVATDIIPASTFDATLSPNPVGDVGHLSIHSKKADNYHLNLLNLNGQVLKGWSVKCQEKNNEVTLDFADIPLGMFFLKITNDKGDYSVLKLIHVY